MRLTNVVLLTFLLLLSPSPSFSLPAPSSNLGDLRISFLSGDIQTKTGDTSEWVPASINMPLLDGDSVWVPEGGRAALQMRDGTYVRLDEKSSMDLLTLGRDSSQFYLSLGRAYVNFRGLPKTFLQMDTPASSVRAYEKSLFRTDVSDNGDSDISVFKGALYAEGTGGKMRISAGNILSLRDLPMQRFRLWVLLIIGRDGTGKWIEPSRDDTVRGICRMTLTPIHLNSTNTGNGYM